VYEEFSLEGQGFIVPRPESEIDFRFPRYAIIKQALRDQPDRVGFSYGLTWLNRRGQPSEIIDIKILGDEGQALLYADLNDVPLNALERTMRSYLLKLYQTGEDLEEFKSHLAYYASKQNDQGVVSRIFRRQKPKITLPTTKLSEEDFGELVEEINNGIFEAKAVLPQDGTDASYVESFDTKEMADRLIYEAREFMGKHAPLLHRLQGPDERLLRRILEQE
jgi:hypothetical protein